MQVMDGEDCSVHPLFPSYRVYSDGLVFSTKSRKFLKVNQQPQGGLYSLMDINGSQRSISVNKLVYETFKGPVEDYDYILQIDGDKTNHNLSNLKVLSPSEVMYLNRPVRVSVLDYETAFILKSLCSVDHKYNREWSELFGVGDSVTSSLNSGRRWSNGIRYYLSNFL